MKYKLDLGSPKNKEAKHIIFIVAKATGTNVQLLTSCPIVFDISESFLEF